MSSHIEPVSPPRNFHAASFCASSWASRRAAFAPATAAAAASAFACAACAFASTHALRWAPRDSSSFEPAAISAPQRGRQSSSPRTKSRSACAFFSDSLACGAFRCARASRAAAASRAFIFASCSTRMSARSCASTRGCMK